MRLDTAKIYARKERFISYLPITFFSIIIIQTSFVSILRQWGARGLYLVKSNSTHSDVMCESTHTTTFAVLVKLDSTDEQSLVSIQKKRRERIRALRRIFSCYPCILLQNNSTRAETALHVVSYIGCAISIGCLLLTISVFIILR